MITEIIKEACKFYVMYEALEQYREEVYHRLSDLEHRLSSAKRQVPAVLPTYAEEIFQRELDVLIPKFHIACNITMVHYNTFGRIGRIT